MKHNIFSLFALAVVGSLSVACAAESDLLARNTVLACYENTVEQPCRFMTADCPDRCDHAKRVAIFRVLKNEDYAKQGEYGDDKLEAGSSVMVDVIKDEPGQAPEIRKLVAELKPGDVVRMTIHHNYVKEETVNYPARPVVGMEKIGESGGDVDDSQKP